MATLYEIDSNIQNLIDLETGEIADFEAFEALQMDRVQKIEGIALWHKNLVSDAEQYKAEKLAFAEKQSQAEKKAESLKNLLDMALGGETFKSVKVNMSYRKSKAVEVMDVDFLPRKYLKIVPKSADKVALKKAIESGTKIRGVSLVEKLNLQIK